MTLTNDSEYRIPTGNSGQISFNLKNLRLLKVKDSMNASLLNQMISANKFLEVLHVSNSASQAVYSTNSTYQKVQ